MHVSHIPEGVFDGLVSERVCWTINGSHSGLTDSVSHPCIEVESVGSSGIDLVQN